MLLFVESDVFDVRVVFGIIAGIDKLLLRQDRKSLLVKDIFEVLELKWCM